MAYGTVKVDNITFDNGGSDQNVTVSGLYRATTSGVTLSGTIAATTVSGVTIIGSTTVSGATVTGTTANFTSGNFSNIISSAATMSGALIMANQQQVRFREAVGNGVNHIALQAPAIVSADQTITLPDQTGTVVTTGDNGSVSSTMLATNLTISAAAGSATTPSIAFTGDLNTGIYSPGADQLAVATNGTGRLFVDSSGRLLLGTSTAAATVSISSTSSTPSFQNASTSQAGSSAGLFNWSTANSAAYLNFSKSKSGTIGTRGQVGSGDDLGSVLFAGDDGTNFVSSAGILAEVDGTPGTNNMPGRLVFRTKADGATGTPAERLRIDSSGRVGIGTSSPSSTLEIRAVPDTVGTTNGMVSDISLPGLTAAQINSTTIGIGTNRLVVNYAGDYHIRSFWGFSIDKGAGNLSAGASNSVNADSRTFAVRQYAGGTTWNTQFCVNGSGNVGIGTSSPVAGYKTTISGDGGAIWAVDTNPTNAGSRILSVWRTGTFNSSDFSSHFLLFQRPDGTTCGAISRNGTTSVNYNTSSDYRLKENVAPVPDGITRLQQLKPIRFNFIAEPNRTVDGFLAHEVQDIVPEAINGTKDEVDDDDNPIYQGIDQSKLVPLLTAALQEAIARIETLEAAVTALQGA